MLDQIDHETRLGLWLNRDRTETRRAVGVLQAISAAFSNKIPKGFFEAVADTPEEADAHYQLQQAQR